jgi:hypothetical protein
MFHDSPVFDGRNRRHSSPEVTNRVKSADRDLLIRDFLEHLDSPRALSVWLLYVSGEHRQLVELTIDPNRYETAESFKRDYAATKLLSKCVGLKTGIDLEAVAIKSAEEAELICQRTNQRIRDIRSGKEFPGRQSVVWYHAAAKIRKILGPLPHRFGGPSPFRWGEAYDARYQPEGNFCEIPFFKDVGWSKGRTTARWGDELSSAHKYSGRPDVTVNARRFAVQLLRDSPLWGASAIDADGPCSVLSKGLNVITGNVMITVPKSAKTDRVICYEPHMNIRLQLAVGGHIRSRLKKFGIDLDDQSVNQRRALEASASGVLATLDLRSASDTLSRELVYELLPFDWACLLDDLRSKYTTWPGGQVRLNEKFSSMGNGYTFELESLIFYALVSAVSGDVTVYGDDIILPAENFSDAVEALEYAGFATNPAKSFSTGPFRESCGTDAFGGFLVTPVYLRRLPKTVEDVVKLHNAIRRWALQDGNPGDPSLRKLLQKWRGIHPCISGPSGVGDGHYHVEFQDACPHKAGFWIEGWWYHTYVRTFQSRVWGDDTPRGEIPGLFEFAALCAAVGPKKPRSLWDTGIIRRQVSYKKIRALVPSWPVEDWWEH